MPYHKTFTTAVRDNKAAIIDSIASSYAMQRPKLAITTSTLTPAKSNAVKEYPENHAWPYYEYQENKAKILEEMQRKLTNVTNASPLSQSWKNANISSDHQRKFKAKHHRLMSKGKRFRSREYTNYLIE